MLCLFAAGKDATKTTCALGTKFYNLHLTASTLIHCDAFSFGYPASLVNSIPNPNSAVTTSPYAIFISCESKARNTLSVQHAVPAVDDIGDGLRQGSRTCA